MSIGQFQLQSAVYSALNVSAITSTLSCGVYDEVIEGNTYPFITLGEETAIEYGTKDLNGGEYTINIHIWSQYKGCLLYTSPSPRDGLLSRMPSSA